MLSTWKWYASSVEGLLSTVIPSHPLKKRDRRQHTVCSLKECHCKHSMFSQGRGAGLSPTHLHTIPQFWVRWAIQEHWAGQRKGGGVGGAQTCFLFVKASDFKWFEIQWTGGRNLLAEHFSEYERAERAVFALHAKLLIHFKVDRLLNKRTWWPPSALLICQQSVAFCIFFFLQEDNYWACSAADNTWGMLSMQHQPAFPSHHYPQHSPHLRSPLSRILPQLLERPSNTNLYDISKKSMRVWQLCFLLEICLSLQEKLKEFKIKATFFFKSNPVFSVFLKP